jgi:hypothetical protein
MKVEVKLVDLIKVDELTLVTLVLIDKFIKKENMVLVSI